MKKTEKKKPVNTIPEGVWESGRPDDENKNQNPKLSTSTDLQGNGYPTNKSAKND